MGSTEKVGYEPSTEFEEVKIDPLFDISLSDSTELWLIHYPKIQNSSLSDLDGQEVTLKLHHDKNLGSFVGSSGKSYDMVKTPALNNDVAVFLSSATGSKIVGKISRGVSLVRYPEPSELQNQQKDDKWKVEQKAQRAVESLSNLSRHSSTPSKTGSRSVGHKSSSSMHNSSRTKSSRSGLASGSGGSRSGLASGSGLGSGSGSKTPKRRPIGGELKSCSGKERSGVTDEDIQIKRKKIKTEG